ncbi:hypothetical protein [Streptomyces silvisoli]|uniref:Acyl-CoA dehydrogenase n=1 Tax=Streptomyces silvisoli TaxID=3034235 RepID=A0ABT5ZS57_9ACTN|nr:hypothetical protein [Streptomyces silvisoli]MDF3292665.1 hypothetical protein [Streptomyces silvisoli]
MTTELRPGTTGTGDTAVPQEGPAVGALAAFHLRMAGPGAALVGPGGHALVPADTLDSVSHLVVDGRRLPRNQDSETVFDLPALDDVVALSSGLAGGAEPDAGCLAELGRLRHAWSQGLLRAVVVHLGGRTSGDGTLLDHQLVKGALADAVIGQRENETLLAAADAEPDDLRLLHDRITEVDRVLLRLAGAYGFTAEGPGRTVHLSELLSHLYLRGEQ